MSDKLNYLDKKGLAKVFSILKFGHKKIWHGTLAEWEALSATEKAKYDQAEVIDEYTGVPVVVDKVESGNLNPVTSNAVAEYFADADAVKSGDVTLESPASLLPTGWFKYYQSGHVVNVKFHGVVPGGTAERWFKVGQLPSTVKFPTHEVLFLAEMPSHATEVAGIVAKFSITKRGAIMVWNPINATDAYLAGNCTYIAQ